MPVTRGTPARQPKNAPPEPEEVEDEVAEEEQEEEETPDEEEVQEEEPADEEVDSDEADEADESDVEEEPEPEGSSEEEADEEAESDETASAPESETPSQTARRGRPRNPETPTPKPLSKAEKAALFTEWEARRALILELRQHLENSKKDLSAAAFEIYDKLGKGPFRWKGKVLKAVKSKNSPAASIRVVSDEAQDIG